MFEKGCRPWEDGSTEVNHLGSRARAAGSSSYIVAKSSQAIGDGNPLVGR